MTTYDFAEHEGLRVHVYGIKDARTLAEEMQQGYTVLLHGVAVPRCDLTTEQRAAVAAYLAEHWPQHAKI